MNTQSIEVVVKSTSYIVKSGSGYLIEISNPPYLASDKAEAKVFTLEAAAVACAHLDYFGYDAAIIPQKK